MTCSMMGSFSPGRANDGTMMSNADWTGPFPTAPGPNYICQEGVSTYASTARITGQLSHTLNLCGRKRRGFLDMIVD